MCTLNGPLAIPNGVLASVSRLADGITGTTGYTSATLNPVGRQQKCHFGYA